jgi:long-chain acyl-CoA synthetase
MTADIQRPWLATYEQLGLDWSQLPTMPDNTLYRYVAQHAGNHPDRCALTLQGWEINYRDLHQRVLKIAQLFHNSGARAGDVLAIHLPNLPDYILALVAASRLGVKVTSLSPLLSGREIKHQLADAGASFLVGFAPLYATHLKAALAELSLTRVWLTGPGADAVNVPGISAFTTATDAVGDLSLPDDTTDSHDTLYLQYTGGTTGAPKAAGLSSANIFINNLQADIFYGYREGKECIASAFPLFHIGGLAVVFNAIRAAATFILSPDPRDIPAMVSEMERHPPTVIAAVPALFQMLLAEPRFRALDFNKLIIAISGGAPFAESELAELEKVVGANKLCEVYGMTETSPVQTLNPPSRFRPGWVGVPLPGTDVCIVDADKGDTEMPLGEAGEIIASGPQVMAGYVNHPEGNAKALRQFKGKTWMYTGDVGYFDKDGYLKICDRSKDMLIVGGYKVFSVEVENKLVTLPEITTCAVVGSPDEKRPGNDIVHLFVQPAGKPDEEQLREKIIAWCRDNMAPYKVPRQIHFLDALPLTSVGKLDKKALRARLAT